MKKYIATAFGILAACDLYAGSMGKSHRAIEIQEARKVYSFFGLEGGYTWNKLQGFSFATSKFPNILSLFPSFTFPISTSYSTDNSGGSVRLSGGMMRSIYKDSLYFGGELGLGYYGQTTKSLSFNVPTGSGIDIQLFKLPLDYKIAGFDALLGLTFNQQDYDLFLKGGALLRNTYFKTNFDLHNSSVSTQGQIVNINASLTDKFSTSQVLPMIKTGATYHYSDNIGVTVSYAHAFSYTTETNLNYSNCTTDPSSAPCGSSKSLNLGINSNFNTSLDMVLAGIQYRLD